MYGYLFMIFQSFNLLEYQEKEKKQKDDVSPGRGDVSPRVDISMTSPNGGRLGTTSSPALGTTAASLEGTNA
jgi:hypothetical protein